MKDSKIKKTQLSSGFPYICCFDRFALCGQPRLEDLKAFQKEGWTSILNLRNSQELEALDFDIPGTCERLNLEYNHIPIIFEGNFSLPAFKEIHKLLSGRQDKKCVIHCASGARVVLALLAHLLYSKNCEWEDCPSLAIQMGLSHRPEMISRFLDFMSAQNEI